MSSLLNVDARVKCMCEMKSTLIVVSLAKEQYLRYCTYVLKYNKDRNFNRKSQSLNANFNLKAGHFDSVPW
jgi:hypothetical protein